MGINEFFINYQATINGISNIFTAIGTVGAVIVALYFSIRQGKPKLKVYSTVTVIIPGMKEHLWLSCVNFGKPSITCTGFSFAPNISKPERIIPINCLESMSTPMPCKLEYSEKLDRHYDELFFYDKNLSKFLGRYKLIAKIKMKLFWQVIAHTNIGNFTGKLSSGIINKLIAIHFAEDRAKLQK